MGATDIYLSPHNDDDALFGAYTCLRYRPKIIVLLRSFVEADWDPPVTYETRERESAAAAQVLGCKYEQWYYPDDDPDWQEIAGVLKKLNPWRVWAPLPEPGGHVHHNRVGEIAGVLWPHTVYYSTYTYARGKTTTGKRVVPEPEWVDTKRAAMACYASQAAHPMSALAFAAWSMDEYLS